MHQCEIKERNATLSLLQQQESEKNPSELQKILGSDEEETKEEAISKIVSTSSPNADGGSETVTASSE